MSGAANLDFDGLLRDKVALITGAASGQGRAAALLMGRHGARVVVADVNDEGSAETVKMLEEGGLSLVRHTVLRHTITFAQAEDFTLAIREGRTWRRVWEELGNERMGRVTARFFDRVGGPTEPLTFEPAVALGIAALPGAEVDLANRPHSITAPRLSTVPPSSQEPR